MAKDKKKEFDLLEWRKLMSQKAGVEVTQEIAADLLGFEDASSISKIERGVAKSNPRLENLATILAGLSAPRILDRIRSPLKKHKSKE